METRLRNEDEKLSTEPGQRQGLMPSSQSLICTISSASATGVAQLSAAQACLCRGFISVAYRWLTALVTPHTSLCSRIPLRQVASTYLTRTAISSR
jgi:hypothetical protein